MVLTADGFLDKGFFQDVAVDNDGISIFAHSNLWRETKIGKVEAEFIDHELFKLWIETRTTVSGYFETPWGGYMEMVQDGTDEATVPEESLRGKIVYAKGIAEFDVGDGLVEGKVGGEEGDEDIASGPIFDVCGGVSAKRGRGRKGVLSSRMTLSPKTFTSIAPRDQATRRVRISRIGFERALMSMAQMPRTRGGRVSC